jgi:hypothetical protein
LSFGTVRAQFFVGRAPALVVAANDRLHFALHGRLPICRVHAVVKIAVRVIRIIVMSSIARRCGGQTDIGVRRNILICARLNSLLHHYWAA